MKECKLTVVIRCKDPKISAGSAGESVIAALEDHGIDPVSVYCQNYKDGMVGSLIRIRSRNK